MAKKSAISRFASQKEDIESALLHAYKALTSAERIFDLVRQAMEMVENIEGASGADKKELVMSILEKVLIDSKAVTAEEWRHGFDGLADGIVEGIVDVSKGKTTINEVRKRARGRLARLWRYLKQKVKGLFR